MPNVVNVTRYVSTVTSRFSTGGVLRHFAKDLRKNGRRAPRPALVVGAFAVVGVLVGAAALAGASPQDDPPPVELAEELPATADPTLDPGEPATSPGDAGLQEGVVEADDAVAELSTQVALGEDHSKNGAVAAFAAYSQWLLGSPAATAEPEAAVESVASDVIDSATALQLVGMERAAGDGFDVPSGAYRVLAAAGAEEAPEQLMLEIAAPLTVAGQTRWAVVGGVVKWESGAWHLVSMAPREIAQPDGKTNVGQFTDAERASTLEGLGWFAFPGQD